LSQIGAGGRKPVVGAGLRSEKRTLFGVRGSILHAGVRVIAQSFGGVACSASGAYQKFSNKIMEKQKLKLNTQNKNLITTPAFFFYFYFLQFRRLIFAL